MLSFHINSHPIPTSIVGIQVISCAYVADCAAGDSVNKVKPSNTTSPWWCFVHKFNNKCFVHFRFRGGQCVWGECKVCIYHWTFGYYSGGLWEPCPWPQHSGHRYSRQCMTEPGTSAILLSFHNHWQTRHTYTCMRNTFSNNSNIDSFSISISLILLVNEIVYGRQHAPRSNYTAQEFRTEEFDDTGMGLQGWDSPSSPSPLLPEDVYIFWGEIPHIEDIVYTRKKNIFHFLFHSNFLEGSEIASIGIYFSIFT